MNMITQSILFSNLNREQAEKALRAVFSPFGSLYGEKSPQWCEERDDRQMPIITATLEMAVNALNGLLAEVSLPPGDQKARAEEVPCSKSFPRGVKIITPSSGTEILVRLMSDETWRINIYLHYSVNRAEIILDTAGELGIAPSLVLSISVREARTLFEETEDKEIQVTLRRVLEDIDYHTRT